MQYNYDLNDLLYKLNSRKDVIVRYLKKHFKENIDYINLNEPNTQSKTGGLNKINYKLTDNTYNLILNSYNINNTVLVKINNVKFVHPIIMSIEKATISFIEKSLYDITKTNREFKIGIYRIDLYIPKFKIAIECDEHNHKTYNTTKDIERENYIKEQLNCIFIRYDPTSDSFDLSKIINLIFVNITKVQLN